MSYGIVRVQKFGAGSVKGIEIHDRREKDHSHTNKEIDYEKTSQNYSLHETEGTFRQAVNERISQLDLTKAVRKDAVVMSQVLVTSDREFFDKLTPEQTKEFFKQSYDFLEKRYGKENVVSSTVHMDERTPHMHFNFVPVTEDGRLSAKSILNRTDLIRQHDDFYKEIGRNWGLSRGEKEGYKVHLETAELKKQTAYKEIEKADKQLKELKEIKTAVPLEAEKGKLMYHTHEVEAIKEQNRALKLESYEKGKKIDVLSRDVSTLQNRLTKTEKELEEVKPHIEHLKDLQSENKALEGYLKRRPELAEKMASFERQRGLSYEYGKVMESYKLNYQKSFDFRRESVQDNYRLDGEIRKCDTAIKDLRNRQEQIQGSDGRLVEYQNQLKQTTGIFKGKERRSIQEDIDRESRSLEKMTVQLKEAHGISPDEINRTIQGHQDTRNQFLKDRAFNDNNISASEKAMEKSLKGWKYMKAMSETQEPGFREISTRHDARINVSDPGKFQIQKSDRAWIIEDMEKNHPNNSVRCKALFEQLEQKEQAKSMAKTVEKVFSRGLER